MMAMGPDYLLHVFLVFVRISGVLAAAPFFSHASVPVRVRVLFAVLLAYSLAGLVGRSLPAGVAMPAGLAVAVGVEALTAAGARICRATRVLGGSVLPAKSLDSRSG